ncbi:MAG: hypothetical protein WKF83_05705 [Nocardioidaceae bacterium]
MLVLQRTRTHDDSLWEPGHPATRSAGDQLQAAGARARMPDATGLVVSGSLPPGMCDRPAGAARCRGRLSPRGVPVIVDVDDEPLSAARRRWPGVVLVPNADELSRLAGSRLRGRWLTSLVAAQGVLLDDGAAGSRSSTRGTGRAARGDTGVAPGRHRLDGPLDRQPDWRR